MERELFEIVDFEVRAKGSPKNGLETEARIRVKIGGEERNVIAEGNGPVNALDNALRKALLPSYAFLAEVQLINYQAFISSGEQGTASSVDVVIVSSDGNNRWTSSACSTNIIEASLQALVDSFKKVISRSSVREQAKQTG